MSLTDEFARLAKFFQAARIAVLEIDASGSCHSANEAWVEITGAATAESLGRGWMQFLPETIVSQLAPMSASTPSSFFSVDVSRHAVFRSQLNVQVVAAGTGVDGKARFFVLFNVAQVTWSSAGILSRATEGNLGLVVTEDVAFAPTQVEAASVVIAPSQPLAGLRILVVEDSPVSQTIAQRLLEKAGCIVDVASDGHEAVAIAKTKKFDVILMDCEMPDMDGFQATRVLRSTCLKNARVPIIALTGHASVENERKCFAAGMTAHIPKPFDPDFLERTILRYVQGLGSERRVV